MEIFDATKNDGIFSILEGEKITLSLRGNENIELIASHENGEEWVKKNQFFDENYFRAALEKNLKSENLLQRISKLFEFDSSRRDFIFAENNFDDAVRFLQNGDRDDAQKKLENFAVFLKSAVEKDAAVRETASVFLENKLKFFQFSLPGDNLFLAKNALQNGLEIVAENKRIAREKNAKQTLWQAARFATTKPNLVEDQIETFTLQLENLPTDENKNPKMRAEILYEKGEQLEILSTLEKNQNTSVDAAERKIVENVSDFFDAAREARAERRGEKLVEDLSQKVLIYSTDRGRQNATREALKNFDSKEDLRNLLELKRKLPFDVRSQVTRKMIEIINFERKKELLRAS